MKKSKKAYMLLAVGVLCGLCAIVFIAFVGVAIFHAATGTEKSTLYNALNVISAIAMITTFTVNVLLTYNTVKRGARYKSKEQNKKKEYTKSNTISQIKESFLFKNLYVASFPLALALMIHMVICNIYTRFGMTTEQEKTFTLGSINVFMIWISILVLSFAISTISSVVKTKEE